MFLRAPHLVASPAGIMCLLFAITLISACSPKTESVEPPPRLVKTLLVAPQSREGWREFPGVVEAARDADLGFRVSGTLNQLRVEEGVEVKSGQVLARLDDTDFKIQLSSRQGEFEQAKADYERAKRLKDQQLIAQADVDRLKAQYTAASAALDAAQQNIEYTVLKAPFAGLIARRHVNNFEDVSTFQPIYTLQDLSSLHIEVNIPETVMVHLTNQESTQVYAMFDAIKDRRFPLALQAMSTAAEPGSRTFTVTFDMPPVEELNILPGMSVTVRGSMEADPSIIVPPQSVLADSNGQHVFVVENINNDTGTVAKRSVTIESVNERGVVIASGLNSGERLVTAGMSKMYDGLQVRLSEEWSQ